MSFLRSGHQSYTGTLGRFLFLSIKSIPYKRLKDKKTSRKTPRKPSKTKHNKTTKQALGLNIWFSDVVYPTLAFFVFCFSNSSITLPAMCTSISGQILRCWKSSKGPLYSVLKTWYIWYTSDVESLETWLIHFCAINPVHISLAVHTNICFLWLPRREKHCFGKVKWWLVC